AVCGGVIGLLLASWGVNLLRVLGAASLPRLSETRLTTEVIAFTAALSVLTGILFGLVPALQASKPDLNQTLKDTSSASSGGSAPHRLRSLLAISQFAMAMMLLVGAGLLVKSFWRLQQISPGFQPESVLAAGVSLNMSIFSDTSKRRRF